MNGKRILTVQDLSCVGQCSLTVALPVLSHYGVEAAILPTAVLSNHTMFKSWSYLDLTDEIPQIFAKWKENGIKFSAFLLGYLGKVSIMELCKRAFDEFSEQGAPIIIDPAFGDNGKLYGGFDSEYVAAMLDLLKRADIICPTSPRLLSCSARSIKRSTTANMLKISPKSFTPPRARRS